jgi:hypothetical protein
MSLKEFEQMRDARLEQEKIHDLQHAQLSFVMATVWGGSENKAEIEDFMIYKPQKEPHKQNPDEQLRHVEGMNAIMGGGQ